MGLAKYYSIPFLSYPISKTLSPGRVAPRGATIFPDYWFQEAARVPNFLWPDPSSAFPIPP